MWVQIELNPFTGEPEMFSHESRSNVLLRFENDDLVSVSMTEVDEEPLPW
jgi:hypothetical protein